MASYCLQESKAGCEEVVVLSFPVLLPANSRVLSQPRGQERTISRGESKDNNYHAHCGHPPKLMYCFIVRGTRTMSFDEEKLIGRKVDSLFSVGKFPAGAGLDCGGIAKFFLQLTGNTQGS
ncbi:hypothetical protein PoB_001449300 [Plakobranchus ocellatus]|uniref:Uncharacterized protein n=1 Tax=Plakobranchus ocellatus TaxID=259542 RepID=A0AAV3Z043_9GAST|nr:hypothetical protein PoB_001449300 [Plakobranchus ocellatus]